YQITGEISTFQIVIGVFVLYALAFGIFDFLKLDRWMRKKIGARRNVELLSEKDYDIIARNKNPKYIAKKYRYTSTIHLIVFVIAKLDYGTTVQGVCLKWLPMSKIYLGSKLGILPTHLM